MKLLTPYKLGSLELPNRVIMAALTRMRCSKETHSPNQLVADYYSRRASAGLIITEASAIRPDGDASPGSGCIYSDDQVEGWKLVTDHVHQANGRICLQLWHGGRAVHPIHNEGKETISASPISIKGDFYTPQGRISHHTPKEATVEEIKELVQDFRKGAENAKKAGFDAVELNAGHGYLIENFLKDGSNSRADDYGGSVENRSRFCLEVLDQIIDVFGSERTGVKLTPLLNYNDSFDSQPLLLLEYLIHQFNQRNLAFLEVNELITYRDDQYAELFKLYFGDKDFKSIREGFRHQFKGTWIANGGFKRDSGNEAIEKDQADLISYGNLYCLNDTLVEKFQNDIKPLGDDDKSFVKYYKHILSGGEMGYTDLSCYEQDCVKKDDEQKL